MTAISTTPITAPDVTNLTATATVKGIRLDWDKPVYSDVEQNLLFETEIWVAATNDRSAATKLFSSTGDSYLHLLDPALTRYYWIIGNNIYGRTDGDWFPVSSTAGVTTTSALVITTDVTTDAITETSIISSDTSIEFTDTDYGVVQNLLTSNYAGGGALTEITYSDLTFSDAFISTENGVVASYLILTLKNTTSGGTASVTTSATTHGTVTQVGTKGSWSNLANITAADGVFATATATATGINSISATNFDFSAIPSTATLIDMEVIVKGKSTASSGSELAIWMNSTQGAGQRLYLIDLTTTNTEYTLGHNNVVTEGTNSIITNNEHWLSSWFNREDFSTSNYAAVYSYFTTDVIKDSGFGVFVSNVATVGETHSIDYLALKITYSTEDVISQQIIPMVINGANKNFNLPNTPLISTRIAETLADGDNYRFTADMIRCGYSQDSNFSVVVNSSNRVLSFREYKR